ncbi:hypothetical protein T459_29326 [Capsicum annuum]|uniref:Uncharacterized protein n=1 Tax=Capsicum annuum TaxID=4072 RepID=A0A2G2Y5R0_CAPAN|nr:hypothetical protein T459_29326 [Capsicum annuum]
MDYGRQISHSQRVAYISSGSSGTISTSPAFGPLIRFVSRYSSFNVLKLMIKWIREEDGRFHDSVHASRHPADSNSELVSKVDARVQEPKEGEIVRVVPRPTVLENMILDEMKELITQLPEALNIACSCKDNKILP